MPELKRISISLILLSLLLLANGRTPTAPIGDITNPMPTAEPNAAEPTPAPSHPGPFMAIGNMWAATEDAGYCPGFAPYPGGGYAPSLSWPVSGGVLNEGRAFRVGHTGLDIVAPYGRAVRSAASGTVVWAGWTTFGLGYAVAVSHGGFYTVYGHLSDVLVNCWQVVGEGAIIGRVGESGASNFPHLHFELRSGIMSYNPAGYLNHG